MEDNAPEPMLVAEADRLSNELAGLNTILAARSVEGGGFRFKPASALLDISATALFRASKMIAHVAEAPPEGVRRGRWLLTDSGKRFWPLDPRAEECSAEDIALSLCQKPRFNCLMSAAFTVGEHSIRVARVAQVLARFAGFSEEAVKALIPYAVLHDAHEAYLADLPGPVKAFFPEWGGLAEAVDRAIYDYLGLAPMPAEFEPIIAQADRILLVLEMETGYTRFEVRSVEGLDLPRIEDLVPAARAMTIIDSAAMAETWPRSVVRNKLLEVMNGLLAEKGRIMALRASMPPELVPNGGLRADDPSKPTARWQHVTDGVAAEVGPIDLESQLKQAEERSARANARKAGK